MELKIFLMKKLMTFAFNVEMLTWMPNQKNRKVGKKLRNK